MLQYLSIRNLALLDEVALDLEPGFIAVTGETGAGKSILLGALQLLAGARVEKTAIRGGTETCEVEAALQLSENSPAHEMLDTLELPPCEDGCLVLKRSLSRNRMPKILVNGSLTTLGNLQQLGETWIDFHGPGEPQRLFKPDAQRELIDLYAGHGTLLKDYRGAHRQWKTLLAEKESLLGETALTEDEAGFLQKEIDRIDRCGVSGETIAALEKEFKKLDHGRELGELARQLTDGLRGEGGVTDRLADLRRAGRGMEQLAFETEPLLARLESLAVEADDLAAEFESLAADLDIDPARAEAVQARMDEWLDLKRRYGDVDAILEKRRGMVERLETRGNLEHTLERLEKEADALETSLRDLAEKLRKNREKAAAALSNKMKNALPALGFPRAAFSVEITKEDVLKSHGDSRCEFLFSPNAGQKPLPLTKIASSGEIARVMLALKAILAEVDHVPVLVFDEVDANVGGEIGRAVGERLAELAGRHQVFCVTHLPQVAGLAGSHFLVEKKQENDATRVSIEPLHGKRDVRIGELARMLGDRKARSARAHAEELLDG